MLFQVHTKYRSWVPTHYNCCTGPFDVLTHYNCFWGPFWKQGTYFWSALEHMIWVGNTLFTKKCGIYAQNTSRGPLARGSPRQVPRSPPLTRTAHTRLRPLYQGLKVNPSGFLPSPVKPTGSKADGKLMRVNDRSGMELMTERLAKPSAFLEQETPWSPTLSTFYHSGIDIRAYKNFSNNSEGNRNTELISAEKVSNISNSDQAAVRLSCAASSRHLLQGLWALS